MRARYASRVDTTASATAATSSTEPSSLLLDSPSSSLLLLLLLLSSSSSLLLLLPSSSLLLLLSSSSSSSSLLSSSRGRFAGRARCLLLELLLLPLPRTGCLRERLPPLLGDDGDDAAAARWREVRLVVTGFAALPFAFVLPFALPFALLLDVAFALLFNCVLAMTALLS